MKKVSFRYVVLIFALVPAVTAESISFSTTLSSAPKAGTFKQTTSFFVDSEFFEIFALNSTATIFGNSASGATAKNENSTTMKNELAGKVKFESAFSILGGNLVKSSALSRLANPLPQVYTSPASQSELPVSGKPSDLPRTSGSHPNAASFQLYFPHGLADMYLTDEHTAGISSSFVFSANKKNAPKNSKQTTFRVNASWYTYNLSHAAETSWYMEKPYFAPAAYSAFLGEITVRARKLGAISPLLWYTAAGVVESPFGGFSPWFRSEFSASIPIVFLQKPVSKRRTLPAVFTLKARAFYAPADFYTPENRFITARYRYMINPLIMLPLSAKHGVIASMGAVFSTDSATELHTMRAALRVSNGVFAATLSSGLENWYIADGIDAGQETALSTRCLVSALFPALKTDISAQVKWFPGKEWLGTKTEYGASLSLEPRLTESASFAAIPTATGNVTVTSYTDGRLKTNSAFALKWKHKSKRLSLSGKVEFAVPIRK